MPDTAFTRCRKHDWQPLYNKPKSGDTDSEILYLLNRASYYYHCMNCDRLGMIRDGYRHGIRVAPMNTWPENEVKIRDHAAKWNSEHPVEVTA